MTDDDRYALTVNTKMGEFDVEFGPNHHLGAVLGEVLARMGRQHDGTYQLTYRDTPVNETAALGHSRVSDGATLTLRQKRRRDDD